MAWAVPSRSGLCLVALSLLARPTGAEPIVPPGFGVHVYVTGDGFEASPGGGARGVRSTSTLAFDETGALYLARTGRRYAGGEGEELWPLYRIPRGGARLTPPTEAQFYYGPPLLNAQVAAMRAGRELFVTTFDRDRKVGVVYRMRDGRAELFAGGTPPDGTPPLLVQPEGVAVMPWEISTSPTAPRVRSCASTPREASSTRATSPSSARGSWRRATAVSCGSGATGRRRRRGSGVLARS